MHAIPGDIVLRVRPDVVSVVIWGGDQDGVHADENMCTTRCAKLAINGVEQCLHYWYTSSRS